MYSFFHTFFLVGSLGDGFRVRMLDMLTDNTLQ